MNTNAETTGMTVSLTKVNNDVKLKLQLATGFSVDLIVDDSKTVYAALHDAKDDIAAKFSELLDVAVDTALEPERLPVRPRDLSGASVDYAHATVAGVDPDFGKLDVLLPSGAAAILDGKQVASPVAPPESESAFSDGYVSGAGGISALTPEEKAAVDSIVPPKSKKGKTLPPPPSAA